jgi:Zn-dependent protease
MMCGRCETRVCGRCAVHSIVGTRCRACAPETGARPFRGAASAARAASPETVQLQIVLALCVVGAAVAVILYAWANGDRYRLIVRTVVFGGALASMVLHELSHGLVAYWGGDRSIRDRGLLTLNPLKFMDPVYSVAMPMLFLLMGGIPLIGGRTFIQTSNLRSRWWETAVSLAGPGSNLVLGAIIGTLLRVEVIDPFTPLGFGLAYLAVLQIAISLFNLIPVPPLDGFGALAPHLSHEARTTAYSFGYAGYFVVLAAMWMVPAVGDTFWEPASRIADALHVPLLPAAIGEYLTRFR